jgi:hypothetical protein
MKTRQLLLAGILAAASEAPPEALAENNIMVQQITSKAAQLPIEGEFPSLGGATGWLNSPPLTAEALRGKVVLVQVWTYSASTGSAHFPMSARGPRNTGIAVWS